MLTYPDHAGPSLWHNLERSALRYPDKPALICFARAIRYRELLEQSVALAGWLKSTAGLARGERVMLMMQNAPQWLIACYGVFRADAVLVPVNPMNREAELRHMLADAAPAVVICSADLAGRIEAACDAAGPSLRRPVVLVGEYADWFDDRSGSYRLHGAADVIAPDWARASSVSFPGHHDWLDAIAIGRKLDPGPVQGTRDDLAVLPYTSGTTGLPKGCLHPQRTIMHNVLAAAGWSSYSNQTVSLSVLPLYHVAGMLAGCHTPFFHGSTSVMLPRWNRDQAAALIAAHRVSYWSCITTMMIDFLDSPELGQWDLSSLETIGGGGASMPAAVAQRLQDRTGLTYMEGYGLTETFGATHRNPPDAPKLQCLGVPFTGTRAMIIDPDTAEVLPDESLGEIIVQGPQVFDGYWRNQAASSDAFICIGQARWFRTGDLGYRDGDGYYFLVDRLKRMINASGFKVWPAEVEAILHHHPDVLEPCVVSVRDPYRGETVKALIVLRAGLAQPPSAEQIIAWCREQMAAYKAPRIVEFVAELPKSGAGKVLWRELQQR